MRHSLCARIILLVTLSGFVAPHAIRAQSRPRVIHAVDIQIPSLPVPVNIAGKTHLAYELHITNFRPSDVTLTRVEVLDGNRGNRLGDFSGAQLTDRLGRPGVSPDADKRIIGAGMRARFCISGWRSATTSQLHRSYGIKSNSTSSADRIMSGRSRTRVRRPCEPSGRSS